jgi:hypothetical protein
MTLVSHDYNQHYRFFVLDAFFVPFLAQKLTIALCNYSEKRMGCECHRFAKLRSKTVHWTVFPSFVLPLTAHAPMILSNTNTPPCHNGKPCAHYGIPNHRIYFVNEQKF